MYISSVINVSRKNKRQIMCSSALYTPLKNWLMGDVGLGYGQAALRSAYCSFEYLSPGRRMRLQHQRATDLTPTAHTDRTCKRWRDKCEKQNSFFVCICVCACVEPLYSCSILWTHAASSTMRANLKMTLSHHLQVIGFVIVKWLVLWVCCH